jgi:AcrR family transcriptional regulator
MPRPRINPGELELRESDCLRVARRLFLTKGIDGLTMEKIAADTELSKGTIYQHFSSKEDVLAALCLESGLFRLSLLERAALFKGRSRERAVAVAKADYIVFRLHPDYWQTEQLTNVLSLTAKISSARKASLEAVAERSAGIALGMIRDGIASGDLTLPSGLTPEKFLLALLGLTRGLYLYCSGTPPFRDWSGDLLATYEQLFGCTCDGFGWKPLSNDWNYARTVQRVWREIFPAEATTLGLIQKSTT